MYVVSPMLNLIVSFRWRKMLNETILSEFVDWSASPIKAKPDLIVMGMSAHHMLPENGGDHRTFENILLKVKWQIQKISNQTKVIWMNQQPVVETLKVNKRPVVHSDKLEQYNRAARRILKYVFS
jgi:hypothetical protein